MPILVNPRYESFGHVRAAGALLDDAYEAACFVLHRGHSSRLAGEAKAAERVAESEIRPKLQ
jgi:hypothetical protein